MSLYKNCQLCPRCCGIDRCDKGRLDIGRCDLSRLAGQMGYCKETAALRIGFAGIHKGEEPPITGAGGSGTIFVTGCNLGCAFCQNFQISQQGMGRVVETAELAEICLSLQEKGAENINIVTGSHAAPCLALGIEAAHKQGLFIPILWNSSGYDGIETLEILKDFVDVYLPDLKTLDSGISTKFFNAPDYPEHASAAIQKMMEYRKPHFGPGRNGAEVMFSGVMVRHLVIPGFLENTRQVLRWFTDNCKGNALLSLMTQYTPVQAGSRNIPGGYVLQDEYEAVMAMLEEFGIEDGYCQEHITGSDWLPDFKRPNPFSSELSLPVWHWQKS